MEFRMLDTPSFDAPAAPAAPAPKLDRRAKPASAKSIGPASGIGRL